MDTQDVIKQQIEDNPIMLYMKGTPGQPQCGFSAKVVQVLSACGEKFASFNVLEDESIREGIKVYSSWPTIPQLYVNGEFIGGCDIICEAFEAGQLQRILKTAGLKSESTES